MRLEHLLLHRMENTPGQEDNLGHLVLLVDNQALLLEDNLERLDKEPELQLVGSLALQVGSRVLLDKLLVVDILAQLEDKELELVRNLDRLELVEQRSQELI